MNKNSQIIPTKFMSVFAVICCIALVGFSPVPGQNPINDIIEGITGSSEGIITGIVTDAETNDPIPDALMTLKYHDVVCTELTDSNGWYTFTEVPICFCLKNVSAYKTGYENQYKMVAVHKITYVNFSLEPINDTQEPDDPEEPGEPDEPEEPEEPENPSEDPDEPDEPPVPPVPPDDDGSMYGVITGVVTDAETKDPITDALMTLRYHDVVRTELTDSNGWYTFTDVPICFCLKNVSASKSGYENQYQLVAVSEMTYVNFSLSPVQSNDSDTNPNTFSRGFNDRETLLESQVYYFGIIVLISGLILLVIGIYIYPIKKKSHDHK